MTRPPFAQLQHSVASELPSLTRRLTEIDETERPGLAQQKLQAEAERQALDTEYRSLLDRSTNIPEDALQARAFIVKGLGLRPEDLPFVGEVVQVREAEAQWTGAIERLLRNFALRMVVRPALTEKVDMGSLTSTASADW